MHAGTGARVIDEIRIALAMSGGIALTVYEAGVAHELWRAARGMGAYGEALRQAGGRLALDIITGASAGGINAVFLGSALSTGADFGALHDLWLEQADLEGLKYRDTPPESLLDSTAIRKPMAQALRANGAEYERTRQGADDIVVTVTRTNLGGRRRILTDALGSQAVVVTREDPITFSAADFRRTDRVDDLVNAALATSAFPVVFPTVEMTDPLSGRPAYYADGGLLDNQPVGHAVKTIRNKKAAYRTNRFVIFVEPNPDSLDAPAPRKPSVGEVALQVPFLGIKGNIWLAATDMEEFNRRRAYHECVMQAMEPHRDGVAARLWGGGQEGLASIRFDEMFLAYDHLRTARWKSVADVAGRAGWEEAAWAGQVVAAARDVDFYLRWLRALIREVNRTVWGEPPAAGPQPLIRDPAAAEPSIKEVLYEHLNALLDALYPRTPPGPEGHSPFNFGRWIDAWQPVLKEDVAQASVQLKREMEKFVARVDGWTTAPHVAARLRAIERDVGAQAMTHDRFREICLRVCGRPDQTALDPALGAAEVGVALFDAFKHHDLVDYALDATTDLHHKLDIRFVRISPLDARNLDLILPVPPGKDGTARVKLAGEILGHMGGFLEERWRRNDYIWGRLDAAEVLLNLMASVYPTLGRAEDLQARLRLAQAEILEDEYARYQTARPQKPPLPRPAVGDRAANGRWIGSGGEALSSLPPEKVRATMHYLVDTSLTLGRGNPYVPTAVLDWVSRLLRGVSVLLRVASRLLPGAPASLVWGVLGYGLLLFGAGYLLGQYSIKEITRWLGSMVWIAATGLLLFLLGAVAGWYLWIIVPAAAVVGVMAGAAAGPWWTAWAAARLSLSPREALVLGAALLAAVLLLLWGTAGRRQAAAAVAVSAGLRARRGGGAGS
ncbi:MAG: DUF3376 domain-containing protein [Armatimonadetes bacterium]|nr:DUF3376 domain-containing protein [Armatimonadota bacterium]